MKQTLLFIALILSTLAVPLVGQEIGFNEDQSEKQDKNQPASVSIDQVAFDTAPKPGDRFVADLWEVAGIASKLVDGEECLRLVTDRAQSWLFKKHPRDEWFGADNYDVNAEGYIRVKKLLIRLATLKSFPLDCNLWLVARDRRDHVLAVIRNLYGYSSFYGFGSMHQPCEPEMTYTLKTGKRAIVTRRGDLVSVLAPVRDSLGDVVGFIEVSSSRTSAPSGHF